MFKKIITYSTITLIGIVGIFGMSGNFVFADTSTNTQTTTGNVPTSTENASANTDASKNIAQAGLQTVVSFVNTILSILTIVVTPAIVLASWLMSPDWTTGDLFNLRPVLHNMWIMISNITYFIYAVLLVFIALATIFNSEHYGYKVLLPRLALGIILVPLTWWFVQFIISLSTIVTASVINIPAEVMMKASSNESSTWWTTPIIPKVTTFDNAGGNVIHTCASKTEIAAMQASQSAINNPNDAALQTSASNAWQKSLDSEINGVEEGTCISPKDFIHSAGGMYSPLLIYGFGVFKFQEIKNINNGIDAVNNIGQLVNQGIIGVIMFVVYGILVIALIAILMMRAIKLWVYAIFSPLFTLRYVLGDGFKKLDESDTFKIGEFIALAFSPAVIGLTLSFGLVIVSALLHPSGDTTNTTTNCTPESCTLVMFGNPANKLESKTQDKVSVTTVSIGGASWEFKGSITKGNDTAVVTSALNTAGGLIGTIIIDIIALIFIWVAFKAGTGLSKAATAAFKPFAELGDSIGKFGASLPKYAPIPGTGTSLAGLSKVSDKLQQNFQSDQQDKIANSRLGQLAGMEGALSKDLQNSLSKLDTAPQNNQELANTIIRQLQSQTEGNRNKGIEKVINTGRDKYMETDAKGGYKFKDGTGEADFKRYIGQFGIGVGQTYDNLSAALKKGSLDYKYLQNDGKGKEIAKTILDNKGGVGSSGGAAGGPSTVNINIGGASELSIANNADAPTIINAIKGIHGSEISKTVITPEKLKEKLKAASISDTIIQSVIDGLIFKP